MSCKPSRQCFAGFYPASGSNFSPSGRLTRLTSAPDRGWQAEVGRYLLDHPSYFPRAAGMSSRRVAGIVTLEIARIDRIAAALDDEYGSPDLGNKPDPVDELVYIALSRRTRESAYQTAYAA